MVLLAAALSVSGCGESPPLSPNDMDVEPVFHEADLASLESWMGLDRSWPPAAVDEATAKLAELRSLESPLGPTQFWLAVAEIVALADNAHSNISRVAVYNVWRILPIRAFWFTDGLFIVRASPANVDLLGGEIIAIAGQTPETLVERMGVYHGGPVEHLRAYFIHSLLLSPTVLQAAGLTGQSDRVPITVRLADGSEVTRVMTNFPGVAPFGLPWRYLSPDPIAGENSWGTVLQGNGDVPWALQERGRTFRYRFLSDVQVSHVQLRANRDIGGESITQFITQVQGLLATDHPRHIILDVRENDGGSLNNTADWALALHDALPPDGVVYSLTSNATFSAGIYTAFFPEAVNPGRTVIVGSLVGDRARFFAEGGSQTLPASGHGIRYSDLAHHLTARCDGAECLFANDPRLDIIVGSLVPEIEAGFTFEDFAAGRDPDVDAVLSLIGS